MSRTEVLGVGFDAVTVDEAVARAGELMARRGAYVCTPNPEIVMAARRDPAVMDALNGADLVLADGTGVVWASKRLGRPLPQRVAGYDFLLAFMERFTGSVFILGGKPGAAEKAARTLTERFPGVEIAGCHDGYFTDERPLTAEIGQTRPDLLLVCLGAPKQELWMASHRDLPVGLMIGLGGSVDVLAGTVPRAPLRWRQRGLEWLYRLLRQPKRFFRQLSLVGFVWAVITGKET